MPSNSGEICPVWRVIRLAERAAVARLRMQRSKRTRDQWCVGFMTRQAITRNSVRDSRRDGFPQAERLLERQVVKRATPSVCRL